MHYFSPLNIFMRKGKDPEPDPYLWLMDPDPGGPKTSGSPKLLYVKLTGCNVSGAGRWTRAWRRPFRKQCQNSTDCSTSFIFVGRTMSDLAGRLSVVDDAVALIMDEPPGLLFGWAKEKATHRWQYKNLCLLKVTYLLKDFVALFNFWGHSLSQSGLFSLGWSGKGLHI